MAETKKVETTVNAPVIEFNNELDYIYSVRHKASRTTFEVVWPGFDMAFLNGTPLAEFLAARYNATPQDMMNQFLGRIATGPNYGSCVNGPENAQDAPVSAWEDAHECFQRMADEYKLGQRAKGEGKSAKAKAVKYDQATAQLAELGFGSLEEALAALKAKA